MDYAKLGDYTAALVRDGQAAEAAIEYVMASHAVFKEKVLPKL